MAFSGVLSSWLMLARNSLLALLAPSARIFSVSYLRASSASCSWLCCRSWTAACSSSSFFFRAASWCLMAEMSTAVTTSPPSAVRRSEICSQRPSFSSTSRTPLPRIEVCSWRIASWTKRATLSREAPGFRMRGSSEKKVRKFLLQSCSRPSRSHSTKASDTLSMASRSRFSAAWARAWAMRSSVTSRATPMMRP